MPDNAEHEIFQRYVTDLRSSDLLIRIEAAQALGRRGDPRAVAPLIAALDDSEWRACVAAAHALGELGDARAVEPIAQLLRRKYANGGPMIRAIEFANTVTSALQKLGEPGFQSLLGLAHEFI